jgi:itaconate CoA-transferase
MLDALGEWLGQPLYTALYGDAPLTRSGARHPSISPYGHYRAGDGGEVFLSVQSDRDWVALCERVLRRPELIRDPRFADNPLRRLHDDQLTPILEDSFADCGTDELMERLEEAGIANARLRSMAEFAEHPQHRARGRWREFDSPAGPLRGLLPPVTVHGRETPLRPVPDLGQHTEAVRAEFAGAEAADDRSDG